MSNTAAQNRILSKMLERLFGSLVNGPSLNCRPNNSRQRLDLTQIAKLKDLQAELVLHALLGTEHKVKLTARAAVPKKKSATVTQPDTEDETLTPEEKAIRTAWQDQEGVLAKVRTIVEDGRVYEQDTGAHVLNVGFPLLNLPPGSFGQRGGATRRVVAPIAFIPISITLKQGVVRSVELGCTGEGVDLVRPNDALFAWLEQQTGSPQPELFADEKGEDPWREIRDLTAYAAKLVGIGVPAFCKSLHPLPVSENSSDLASGFRLCPPPKTDDDDLGAAILPSAVIGLFPVANQGLLRDMQALAAGEVVSGPLESFIKLNNLLTEDALVAPSKTAEAAPTELAKRTRAFSQERLISNADPCQSRAVRLARESKGLVIHGPPGTGKSQTITNIIGDHLARGERVLVICDKRGALDVVFNRLQHLGLGDFCAIVHDPQRDQRELYMAIRQQLDGLPDLTTNPQAESELAKLDTELQRLHSELTDYSRALSATPDPKSRSFHDLVGAWLAISADVRSISAGTADAVGSELFEKHTQDVQDMLERAHKIQWQDTPWKDAVGIGLEDFLAEPMEEFRRRMAQCIAAAQAADSTCDPAIPPFTADVPLQKQAQIREELAQALLPWCSDHDLSSLSHWLGRDLGSVKAAKVKIEEAAKNLQIFRSTKLSSELMASLPATLPPRNQVADQWKVVNEYLVAFGKWGGLFDRVKTAAPQALVAVITQWMAQEPALVTRAKRKLDDDQSLIEAIGRGAMDRQLALQFERQPFDVPRLIEWLNVLNDYIVSASKWYRFLTPGPKKAAKPVLAFFGLPATANSAERVRNFLDQLRARLDLKADLENSIVKTALGSLPADEELVSVASAHRSVVTALHEIHRAPPAEATLKESDRETIAAPEIINPFITNQVDIARPVLAGFHAEVLPAEARKIRNFLGALHARLVLTQIYHQTLGGAGEALLENDERLEQAFTGHADALDLLLWLGEQETGHDLTESLAKHAVEPSKLEEFARGVKASPVRAVRILELLTKIDQSGLFASDWKRSLAGSLRYGAAVAATLDAMSKTLDDVEGVLRIKRGFGTLPTALGAGVKSAIEASMEPAAGMAALHKAVLGGEISRRLRNNPMLQAVDSQRLKTCFERYKLLDGQKRGLARDLVLHRWSQTQRSRLLSTTGSRLNSLGADLRRRLTTRGERAMRLRQVIAVGQETPDGDPLFDLRPVWMASPETVAQLFPRKTLFDVAIFDEASQCRLEEALPVLTRARRVVIAGDPKQLPPTRFFETAIIISDDEEPETDQELFEQQQADVEDLLGAALNLEIQECYLDVHYRSRNGDLINFSNEQFYGSRLQAIPGHPSNYAKYAPITMYRAEGVYEKRCNLREAEKVCQIVHDLLRRAEPPSIGIACFNLQQRDLIVDKLDELAAKDTEFAGKLALARARQGNGSFEGLFVKNLESVQGDERDHMIISTTYGPDPNGKFYKRFGPLGRSGGGRRLNVLVTRAREEVHLVTSIPAEMYRSLPPVPPGQVPNGGWLLFSYLAYAEHLAAEYDLNRRVLSEAAAAKVAQVNVRSTKYPSKFSKSLAAHLKNQFNQGADVHWGSDGFCIDLALHHPRRAEDVTIGVICDMSRFTQAEDVVEWDVFRGAIMEAVGWKLHRIWTPHFFRDIEGRTNGIMQGVHAFLIAEPAEPEDPIEPSLNEPVQ